MANRQNIDLMGGFRKAMPFTSAMLLIGALALAAFPLTSGWFSKDEILDFAAYRGGFYVIFTIGGYIGALLTAFYAFRIGFRVVFGEPCEEARELEQGHIHHAEPENPATGEPEDTDVGFPGPSHQIAEREWPMKIAMSVLGFGALFAGFVQIPGVDDVVHRFLHGSFLDSKLYEQGPSTTAAYHGLLIGGLISVLGIAIAYYAYLRNRGWTAALQKRFPWAPRLPGAQVVLRRGDRRPRRPPGARRRPLVQRDLRALRRPGAGRRRRPTWSAAPAPACAAPSPATCAPTPCCWSPASPASASTSCCRAHEEAAVIQILLWAPLAAGLRRLRYAAAGSPAGSRLLGRARVRWCWRSSSSPSFDPSGGLQHTVDESWIPTLGVRYQLGVDGISLFLVLLPRCSGSPRRSGRRSTRPSGRGNYFLMFGPGRDGDPRRLPRPGPDPVRPLLRPDADPVLLPVRELGDRASGAAGGGRGPDPARSRRRSR